MAVTPRFKLVNAIHCTRLNGSRTSVHRKDCHKNRVFVVNLPFEFLALLEQNVAWVSCYGIACAMIQSIARTAAAEEVDGAIVADRSEVAIETTQARAAGCPFCQQTHQRRFNESVACNT